MFRFFKLKVPSSKIILYLNEYKTELRQNFYKSTRKWLKMKIRFNNLAVYAGLALVGCSSDERSSSAPASVHSIDPSIHLELVPTAFEWFESGAYQPTRRL